MKVLLIGSFFLCSCSANLTSMSNDGGVNNPGNDGGGGPPGGGGMFPPGNGITFPWPVFDGTVPDVPTSTTGKTWYCDPQKGDDKADGTSFATAKKTLGAVITGGKLAAGDTVLLGGGIYREYVQWSNGPGGKAGAPITIGSYGRGTGAPILDGGVKPNTWTRFTGAGQSTVWQSSIAGTQISLKQPVYGIYVGSDKGEFALRETIHGQVTKYINDPLPPNQTQANITDNSSNWYYDAPGQMVYADFGGTLGSGDPNSADVSILYDTENSGGGHQNLAYLSDSHSYMSFIGLTWRASSWSAIYSEASNLTFDHCDFKFNGGAAILFGIPGSGMTNGDNNHVTMSRVWMNILENWPRFNNGNTSGGWPAAIAWGSNSNGLAEGNVVYGNGGEGLTMGDTDTPTTGTNNVIRHNIIFDNFSVNLYLNNIENVLVEENYVFQHPRDPTQTFTGLFDVSPGYDGDFGKRIVPVNISLGDEPGSAYDNAAHLSNITVINNLFAGGNFGIVDYDDGTTGAVKHGLRNCVISNNTWILTTQPVSGNSSFGWRHEVDAEFNMNSVFANNIFVTATTDDRVADVPAGPISGIDLDYNLYGGPGKWHTPDGDLDFTKWKSTFSWDAHSLQADAQLTDVSEFQQPATTKFVYDWHKAAPLSGSPAAGSGRAQQEVVADFTGAQRMGGSHDIGALKP